MCLMFKAAREAHVNHIDRHGKDGDGEDFAQERHVQTLEQFSTRERSKKHPDEDGEGEAGHDVAALDVDHRRSAGRHAHHKVGRGGAHLEGHLHDAVHRNHLQHP